MKIARTNLCNTNVLQQIIKARLHNLRRSWLHLKHSHYKYFHTVWGRAATALNTSGLQIIRFFCSDFWIYEFSISLTVDVSNPTYGIGWPTCKRSLSKARQASQVVMAGWRRVWAVPKASCNKPQWFSSAGKLSRNNCTYEESCSAVTRPVWKKQNKEHILYILLYWFNRVFH